MQLSPGTRLGPYEILAPLGAGGMGEVYRARDTRLDRDVAVKALPPEFAQDVERLARFEREAKLLASLSHPNIAGIFGLEVVDGARYLVLEFVEGESLADRLARGALSIGDAMHVCAQVATAVEIAHEAGIVHRDLKPGNVMLKPDGEVKVLDFGLAKAGAAGGSDPNLSASPTVTHMATSAGVILGTAAYMSPEQARGKSVDRRTDIWSFGCLLYECLAGRPLFDGETVSDLIAQILQTEPDWQALPADTPEPVHMLLRRCLTRDAKQRLRDIGEARIALEAPAGGDESVTTAPAPMRRGLPMPAALLAGALLVAITAAAVWMLRPSQHAPQPVRVLDLVADGVDTQWFLTPELSPDGSRIAYSSNNRIWVRDLDHLEPRAVADLDEASPIIWSPDGQWIAFSTGNKLFKVPSGGGSTVTVADIPETGDVLGGVWGNDDSIVIAVWRGGLYRVSAASGKTSLVVAPDPATQVDFHYPTLLPDGGILYFSHWKALQDSVGNPRAFLQIFRDGRSHGVASDGITDNSWPAYDDGILLLRSNANSGLYAMAFDPGTAEIRSDPTLVVPHISSFSLANDGSLLYMESREDAVESELGRIDGTGAWQEVIVPSHPRIRQPALSPDGKRIAYSTGTGGGREIWIYDRSRHTDTRLTFDPGDHGSPRWLDNDRVIYSWVPEDLSVNSLVVMQNADGSGTPRKISRESGTGTGSPIIDPTGDPTRFLQVIDAAGRGELRLLDIDDDEQTPAPQRVLQEQPEPNVLDVRTSPDGSLLAYVVDQAGQPEVFLTRFPSGDGKWQVSVDGGRLPRWAHDGRSLYFVGGTGPSERTLDSVEIDPNAAVPLGARRTLFSLSGDAMRSLAFSRGYEVEPGGDGFLVVRTAGGAAQKRQRMILVQNWRAMLAATTGQ